MSSGRAALVAPSGYALLGPRIAHELLFCLLPAIAQVSRVLLVLQPLQAVRRGLQPLGRIQSCSACNCDGVSSAQALTNVHTVCPVRFASVPLLPLE